MKKQHLAFITFLFLINSQILFSQSKAENYYNANFEKISKEEFKKTSKQKEYRYNQFDLEDQIANILYQPKTKGRLTAEEFSLVKNKEFLDFLSRKIRQMYNSK